MALLMVLAALLADLFTLSLVLTARFLSFVCDYLLTVLSGNYVGVYGTVPGYYDSAPSAGAISQYFIDNSTSPSSVFTPTPNQDPVYQQPFFQSTYLADGTHSLTVTLAGDTPVGGAGGYWVDFFIVGPPVATTHTTSTPPPSTKSDNRNSSVPIGPIVGGIMGGIAFLLLLSGLLSLYILRRRQSRHRSLGSFDSCEFFLLRLRRRLNPKFSQFLDGPYLPLRPIGLPLYFLFYQRPTGKPHHKYASDP